MLNYLNPPADASQMLVHRTQARRIPTATVWLPVAEAFTKPSKVSYELSRAATASLPTAQFAFVKLMLFQNFIGRISKTVVLKSFKEFCVVSQIGL